jgi:hypothetical protein
MMGDYPLVSETEDRHPRPSETEAGHPCLSEEAGYPFLLFRQAGSLSSGRAGSLSSLVCFLLFLAFSAQVRADTLTGEVRGQVLDIESGRPLPGVRIVLENSHRSRRRELATDSFGRYLFLQLEPGNYTVAAELNGYYSSRRTDVLIRLNRPKVVVPPFELRRLVTTPTRQITLTGEQTKIAIVDLAASGSAPVILAITEEEGLTALVTLSDWAPRFNFGSEVVLGLPLRDGRSFDQLALLSPGVFRVPFSSGVGPAVGLGVGTLGQFSVNGSRGRSNNFTVDGSDNNDADVGVRRQGFVSLVPQSSESLEEFQVVTAGFPAESGRNSGAQVNAVSRSGGGGVHGNVVGVLTNGRLRAGDFFETPFRDRVNAGALDGGGFDGKDGRSTQVGATAGGPLVAERLFYFLSGEHRRDTASRIGHFVVPTDDERGLRTTAGFIPIDDLEGFFQDRNIPYSSAAGRGVFSLYPLPNHPGGPFGRHTYSQVRRHQAEGVAASVKTDWYPTANTGFSVRYNFTDDESVLPFTSEAINSSLGTDTRTQNLSLFLNTTGIQWANALRVSYGRTALGFPPDRGSPLLFGSVPIEGLPQTGPIELPYGGFGPFGVTGPVGQIHVLPYSPIGIDVFNFPQGRVENTYQVSDFVTRTSGRHVVMWGFDLRRSELNSFNDRNSRPLLHFAPGLISGGCQSNPLCLFATPDGLLRGTDTVALGAPAGFLQNISTQEIPDSSLGLSLSQLDLFVRDDWRVSTRLTLNLGIRYERQSVPRDRHRRIENTFGLRPSDFPRPEPGEGGRVGEIIELGHAAFDRALEAWNGFLDGRGGIYASDGNNWSPRLGFAWDLTGRARTVLRGGYALAYDAALGAVTSRSRNVFPTFVPLNLDLNFSAGPDFRPNGKFLNSPVFFEFAPTGQPLITPGTLNRLHLRGEVLAAALGSLFIQAPPFPGASLSSNGLAFTLPEKDMRTAFAHHAVLGLEHQLGEHYLLAARYVGTRSRNLTRFLTPNAGMIATPVLFSSPVLGPLSVLSLPPTTSPESVGRPNQALGSYTVFGNSATAEYHSFQLSMEKRLSRGTQFQAHWTWSHALDEVSDPFGGRGFPALPQNLTRLDLEWASASFDVRHRIVGFMIWDIPGLDKALLRQWRLSLVAELQTGQPFTVNSALDRNFDGNLTDRLDSIAGIVRGKGSPTVLSLAPGIDPGELLAPRGENGRVGRNSFRAPGITSLDMALTRRIAWNESIRLELRTEVFNILGRTHFAVPVRTLESPAFGSGFDTQLEPRTVRLLARLQF